MNMTKITPITDRHYIDCYPSIDFEDIDGVSERFMEGFSEFLQQKKEEAVLEVVREEFPQLVDDEEFIQQVITTLGNDNIVEEKRFVFLALNPNLKR
jgi:chorismate mutase